MQVLLNHVGFAPAGDKHATVQHDQPLVAQAFSVVDLRTRAVVHAGFTVPTTPVDGWRGRHFAQADLTAVTAPGRYAVMLDGTWPPVQSQPFEIADGLFGSQMLSDLVHYFKGQRCTGLFDAADRRAPLLDTRAPRDVHGGWYDASGDCSKYLSHLSYANFMNPQQTPLVTWTLLAGIRPPPAAVEVAGRAHRRRGAARRRASWCACRRPRASSTRPCSTSGAKGTNTSARSARTATQKGVKSADYQATGSARAAVWPSRPSRARHGRASRRRVHARAVPGGGDPRLRAARGPQLAEVLDDHAENLIDDYCALLAASELCASTRDTARGSALPRATPRGRWRSRTPKALLGRPRTHAQLLPCERRRPAAHRADALPASRARRDRSRSLPTGRRPAPPSRPRPGVRTARDQRRRRQIPLGYPRQHVVMPGRDAVHAVLRAARQRERLLGGRAKTPASARWRPRRAWPRSSGYNAARRRRAGARSEFR